MKKGFFVTRLPLLLAFVALQGCSTFLLSGEGADDPAEYDRGYSDHREANANPDDDNASAIPRRSLASADAADDLGYEQRRIRRAIEMRDVVLGMTQHDVMESWGQPSQREVAGRGTAGHERWTFGSRYSLSGSRTVIFENGRVAGWSH